MASIWMRATPSQYELSIAVLVRNLGQDETDTHDKYPSPSQNKPSTPHRRDMRVFVGGFVCAEHSRDIRTGVRDTFFIRHFHIFFSFLLMGYVML